MRCILTNEGLTTEPWLYNIQGRRMKSSEQEDGVTENVPIAGNCMLQYEAKWT